MAISDVFKSISANRRAGTRVLVDNLATSLVYTVIEPLYRFLHALLGRVTDGGAVVATLDTDGTDDADRQALVGLFETVVEVRRAENGTEFRVVRREGVPNTWVRHTSRGSGT